VEPGFFSLPPPTHGWHDRSSILIALRTRHCQAETVSDAVVDVAYGTKLTCEELNWESAFGCEGDIAAGVADGRL